jgi:hypothetical protein
MSYDAVKTDPPATYWHSAFKVTARRVTEAGPVEIGQEFKWADEGQWIVYNRDQGRTFLLDDDVFKRAYERSSDEESDR